MLKSQFTVVSQLNIEIAAVAERSFEFDLRQTRQNIDSIMRWLPLPVIANVISLAFCTSTTHDFATADSS